MRGVLCLNSTSSQNQEILNSFPDHVGSSKLCRLRFISYSKGSTTWKMRSPADNLKVLHYILSPLEFTPLVAFQYR